MIPVVYFALGMVAGVLGLCSLALSNATREKRKVRSKHWSKVERLTWVSDFNVDFDEVVTGTLLGQSIAQIMSKLVTKGSFPQINIEPGNYDCSLRVTANFIKREKEPL